MSRKVWKFVPEMLKGEPGQALAFTVDMPVGAEVLTAAFQGGRLMVWAEVTEPTQDYSEWTEPTNKDGYKLRYFKVYRTGWDFEDEGGNMIYVTTLFEGPYVWHVYEIPDI